MSNQVNVNYVGTQKVWVHEGLQQNLSVYGVTAAVEERTPKVSHIVLLVDLSYSMTWAMKLLQDMVKAWPRGLSGDTFISVIVYSGHGDSKTIISAVRADEVSLKMAKYDEVIERELRPISNTVISEPLETTMRLVKDAASICDFHGVVLMTDGCLVPSLWSRQEEAKKCLMVADACKKAGVALNAVGFGHYYDREFLKELVDEANTGVLTHAEDMGELSSQINDISFGLSDAIAVNLEVELPDESRAVIPTAGTITKGSFRISHLPRTGTVYFGVLHDSPTQPYVRVLQNASTVLFKSEASVTPVHNEDSLDTVILGIAMAYAKQGDVDDAEFVIRQLGDVALADSLASSYSFKESGEAIEKIRGAVQDKSTRFLQGRHPAEPPKPERICVIDLVYKLVNDEGNELLWAVNTPYKSISRRKVEKDDNVEFVRDEEAVVKVNTVVVAANKLNIGIKVQIPGKAVDKVSGASLDCSVFRDRNLVHDGNLNVPYLTAKLNRETFDLLKTEGVLASNARYSKDRVYKLPLDGLKMVNKSYSKSMTAEEIAQSLYEINVLKAEQYALNAAIRGMQKETVFQPAELPLAEQRLRELLHIDYKGIYSPEGVEDDTSKPVEVYPAMFVEWGVAKFPEKAEKEKAVNALNAELAAFKGTEDEKFAYLNERATKLRLQIRKKEMQVSMVRIASALSRKTPIKWEAEEQKDKKVTSKITGNNLVIGGQCTKRNATIGNLTVVETSWMQLIEV